MDRRYYMNEKKIVDRRKWLRPRTSEYNTSYISTDLRKETWTSTDSTNPRTEYYGYITLGACHKIIQYDINISDAKSKRENLKLLDTLIEELGHLRQKVEEADLDG
jgi:hypothetical protein